MIIQLAILLTGVVAIYLSQQSNEKLQKYACLFGLAGQPFWMITTYESQQFGIFALTFLYTFAWAKGLHNYWIKPRLQKETNDDKKEVEYTDKHNQSTEAIDDYLNKIRKLAGLNVGQGMISRQAFMDEYNTMEITPEDLSEMREQIVSNHSSLRKMDDYSINLQIKSDLNKHYSTRLKNIKTKNIDYKIEHEQSILSEKYRKPDDIVHLVPLYKMINWCYHVLEEINDKIEPRTLIKKEFLLQLESCKNKIHAEFLVRPQISKTNIEDLEFVMLNTCVRIQKFEYNSRKFDIKNVNKKFNTKVYDDFRRSIRKTQHTGFVSIDDKEFGYNLNNINKDDIQESINALKELYSSFEKGDKEPINTVYKVDDVSTIKPLSLLATKQHKAEYAKQLFNYFLLSKEQEKVVQAKVDSMENTPKKWELMKLFDCIKNNMRVALKKIYIWSEMPNEGDYYNSLFSYTSVYDIVYTNEPIEDLKDALLKVIAQQYKLKVNIGA